MLAKYLDMFTVSEELKELAAREEERCGDKLESWIKLGNTILDCHEAASCYASALAIKPDYYVAWNNLGHELSRISQDESAILCYKKALILNIHLQDAGRNLVNLLLKTGRRKDAEDVGRFLDKVHGRRLASDQAAVLYYLAAGETQEALDLITHMREQTAILEKHGVCLVELDFLQGLALFDQKQYEAAAGFLVAASASEKLKSQSYPRLFLCYRYMDDHQRMHEVGSDWGKWMEEQIFLDDPSTFSDPEPVFDAYLKIVENTIRLDRHQLKKWSEFLRKYELGNTRTYNRIQDYRDMIEESLGQALLNIKATLANLNQRLPELLDCINQTEKFEQEELVRIWHAEIFDLRQAQGLTGTREEIMEEIFDLLLNTLTKVLYGSKKTDRDKTPSEYREISDEEVLDYLQIADNLLAHGKGDEKGAHFLTAVVTLCLAVELCWKKYFTVQWEKQYRQEKGPVYFSVYHQLIGKALEENQATQMARVEREILHFLKTKDPDGKIVNAEYKKTMSMLCYKYRNNSMHINKSFNLEDARTCRKWVVQQLVGQGNASKNGLLPRFFKVFAGNQGEGHSGTISRAN